MIRRIPKVNMRNCCFGAERWAAVVLFCFSRRFALLRESLSWGRFATCHFFENAAGCKPAPRFLHNLSTIDSRPPALKLFLDFRWGSRSLASKRSEGIGYSQYLVYLRAQPRSNTFVSFGRQVREPAAALLTQAN